MTHTGNGIPKIVIIGIDGADWRLIKPWIGDGCLKYLSEILNEGVQGTLMSTIPPFTLPAWTSIFTGVNPGKHGITDMVIRIGDEIKPAVSRYRKVPLLWRLLGYAGLKSIVLNDPVTYPPEPINGIMVTGFLTPPNSNSYTYPPEIKDEINKGVGGYMPELPLNYDKLIAHNRKAAYEYVQVFAQKIANLALYMMKNHEWNVFNVTFTSTDRLQHFYWRDKHLLRKHYMWIDSTIGELMNLASNDKANIIIVSDHGFAPIFKSVYVNTILAEEGFIQVKSSKLEHIVNKAGLNSENLTNLLQFLKLRDIVLKLVPERLKQRIPSKNSRSISSRPIAKLSSATGIFINQKLCSNYEAVRRLIIRKLLSLKDGKKNVMARVCKREEVLWGPFTSRAPDLFAIPNEGYYLSTLIKDKIFGTPIQSSSGVRRTGEHRMQGIFIAQGPDIKKGLKLNSHICTWDITPTILHLMDLPIPDYIDGSVKKQIFKEGSSPSIRAIKSSHFSYNEISRYSSF